MEEVKLDSEDAAIDVRHNLNPTIAVPTQDDELSISWCDTCRRMTTEFEIKRYGCCPKCRGLRFRGGWETPWDSFKLWWWMFTHNWRISGEWKKNGKKLKGKKVLRSQEKK